MKIFVTYSNTPNCIEFGNNMHEQFLKKPNIYIPILGGKELYKGNNKFLNSIQGDNIGKNISNFNPYINQHTVIYWVGNHLDEIKDDYIGFCHYRRLFDIPDNESINENTIYINQMSFTISNALYFLLNHDPNTNRNFAEFIQKFIRLADKQTVNEFISFLNSNTLFSGNMFIMHKTNFEKYMSIITPIYNIICNMIYIFPNVNDRSFGFILERLNSFVIFKLINMNPNIKLKQGKYLKLGETIT